MRRSRRRAELARLEAELDEARPFLDLAREVKEEVRRLSADGAVGPDRLVEAIEAVPARERIAFARAVFERLPESEQWAVIERVFGDAEVREALAAERGARLAEAKQNLERHRVVDEARAQMRLDTRRLEPGTILTLGLFREADVSAGFERGHLAASCARKVVLRAEENDGTFRVIADVFNPAGGYFVTGSYDEETWRNEDRLPANGLVRIGSIGASDGMVIEPALHPGGRVDVEVNGVVTEGRLHMGFVMIGSEDVFRGGDSPA